jgi:uncharacterized protein (DUF2267 family)
MATERKTEPKLAEAAAKTAAVLETLRSRLGQEAAPQEPAETQAAPDELDRELEQYFAAGTGALAPEAQQPAEVADSAEIPVPAEIRAQVIDGVVDRILRSWGAPDGGIPASVKSEVIARLVEHVLGELLKKGRTS